MNTKKILFGACLGLFLANINTICAQNNTRYWQQHVDYVMEVDMDVKTFQYTGAQKLVYTNNSPDEIHRVYYHLYFNAFSPVVKWICVFKILRTQITV